MGPLPVELLSRQLGRVFICTVLGAVRLALLALCRCASHVEKVKRCLQYQIQLYCTPRVGLQKAWTGPQESIFTSRMKRRNLAEAN